MAGTISTHYVWFGSQVLAEHDAVTGTSSVDYIYCLGLLIAKVAGTTQYFLIDRLSIRATTDTAGNIISVQGHLPFGEEIGGLGTQEKRHFTTYERDSETGLDYGMNRYYRSATGVFNSSDPVLDSGFNKGKSSCARNKRLRAILGVPQRFDHYGYVTNDPINRSDPTGLELD